MGKKKEVSKRLLFKVWIGVEPTNRGFADRSLTAWVPHHECFNNITNLIIIVNLFMTKSLSFLLILK